MRHQVKLLAPGWGQCQGRSARCRWETSEKPMRFRPPTPAGSRTKSAFSLFGPFETPPSLCHTLNAPSSLLLHSSTASHSLTFLQLSRQALGRTDSTHPLFLFFRVGCRSQIHGNTFPTVLTSISNLFQKFVLLSVAVLEFSFYSLGALVQFPFQPDSHHASLLHTMITPSQTRPSMLQ